MSTVILVIHMMVAATLVGLVLLQRSEGGALGIGGGGGGGGGFMSGRGAANLLTRATGVLAAVFFGTSILLTIIARQQVDPGSILDRSVSGQPAKPDTGKGGILDKLRTGAPEPPSPPSPQ